MQQPLAMAGNPSVKRALVVDDSALCRALNVLALTSLGYAVSTASNGLSGVAAAHLTQFEIITLDVQMPVMNGLECARQIRLIEAVSGARATIIGISGCDCEHQCLKAGMDSFVRKPLSAVQLRAFIHEAQRPKPLQHPVIDYAAAIAVTASASNLPA